MKLRYIASILGLAIMLSGCSTDLNEIKNKVTQKISETEATTEVVNFNEVMSEEGSTEEFVTEEESTGEFVTEEVSTEEYTEEYTQPEQEVQQSKPKKTLADIHLLNVYVHPSESEGSGGYVGGYESSSYPDENYSTTNTIIEGEESSNENSESSEEETEEGEVDTSWDAEMYKSLGIHAPKLDDWYPYKCSSITQKEDVFMYSEVSTENMDKVVKIEFSKNELKISDEYKGASTLTEILGSKCQSSFDDGKNHGELIIKSDDIYCKITTDTIDREEFIEIAKHYKSYL